MMMPTSDRGTKRGSRSQMLQSIRSVLAIPAAYELWWNLVGGPGWAKILVSEYIQPGPGARILEVGCGPGNIARYLIQHQYVGFDSNANYIEVARRRFPEAKFICQRVSQISVAEQQSFDIVLAIGIVHHLDDTEAGQLFQVAHGALKPRAKLITFDGVWTEDQSSAARWILARDRGEHVRTEPEYVNLASQVFDTVKPTVRHDLLRIPYSHLIFECVRS